MSNATLWTAEDVVRATRGEPAGAGDWRATGVSIDSRTLAPGDLFVAIAGLNSNGHDYVAAALNAGASAAIVSEPRDEYSGGPLVVVPDTLKALEHLGYFARERCPARRIAITGSVGKTGTKEMLRAVLSEQAATHASVASYNNLWGVPLTLARMPLESVYGIFEIGMNHAGEITPLTKQVKPDVAIITTVAPVHLEFFDGIDGIARAKAEIFHGLKGGGVAIINADIAQTHILAEAAQQVPHSSVLTFGEAAAADYRLLSFEDLGNGSLVTAELAGMKYSYRLGVAGRHIAVNSLAALAAVDSVGGDVERAADSMTDLEAVKGRGTRHSIALSGGTIDIIDESYNANPVSMAAAIRTLGNQPVSASGRRIAVLGDMLELGPSADNLHAGLCDAIQQANIDLSFLAGPHMKALWQVLPEKMRGGYGANSVELQEQLLSAIRPGDIIMVKGSLGSRMGPVVEALLNMSTDSASDGIPGE